MLDQQPQTAKGRATRDRIVASTTALIGERGLANVSLDAVIARAGVSKGQLYHYFADRDELVRAAAQRTADDLLEMQESLMHHLDTWKAIRTWFDCLVEIQVDVDARGGCPLATLAGHLSETDEQVRLELINAFDRWQGILAAGLATMRDRGTLRRSADPEALATATMASVQGGLLLTQVRRDPNQLVVALDAAYTHLRTFAAAR